MLGTAMAVIEIARVDASMSTFIMVHNSLAHAHHRYATAPMLQQESYDGAVHCIMLTTVVCMPPCCRNDHSALSWSAEPVCAHVLLSQQSLVHTGGLLLLESSLCTSLHCACTGLLASEEQKRELLPGMAQLKLIGCLGSHGAFQRLRCLLAADHRQKGGCSFTHCRGLAFPLSRMPSRSLLRW